MKRFLLTAMAALLATNAMASGNLQSGGGSGPIKVTDVTLAIKSPAGATCPANAVVKAWITTSKAGPVS